MCADADVCTVNKEFDNYSKEDFISTIIMLREELAQLKRMIFGSKSERFVPEQNPQQLPLFIAEASGSVEVKTEEISYTRTKVQPKENKHQGRLALPKHLPRVEHIIEPEESTEGLVCIGKEITEELECTPTKFFVNRFIRPKYAKPNQSKIIIGALPSRPIEKGIPGPALLSYITCEKFVYHSPLHRLLQRFRGEQVQISPSTISDWIRHVADLLAPLYDLLHKRVLQSGYIMADETPIKVLDKDKKGATHQGYYWVYRAANENLVVFDYRNGRGREGPTEILKDYKGFLQTDGYAAYDIFDNTPQITLLHCMAHARRYFEQALDSDKVRAEYFLAKVQQLYAVEKRCRAEKLSVEQRYELRQKESVPILDELHQWLKDNITKVLPKSSIGKAIAYSLSRWEKLSTYAYHGHLNIDNNPVENSIRPVALGRKNYLFAGSHEAARRAGTIYSLMATCTANDIDPMQWLTETLSKINGCKSSEWHTLLPLKKG